MVDADQAPSGINISALTLNGGTIQSAQGVDANLTLTGVNASSGSSIIVRGTYTLTTTKYGSGSGTVTRSPNQTQIRGSTSVTLTPNPDAGSSFINWSGDASGSANPLTFSMDGDKTITYVIELTGNVFIDSTFDSTTPGWGVTRFAKIQDAIDYAKNHPASGITKVNIAAANYGENVNLNTDLILAPAAGVKITGTLTQSTGTISAPAGNLTVTGDYVLSGGTFDGNSSGTLTLGSSLTRTDPGVFNSGGTVVFNGASPAVISGVTQFNNLTLSGSSTVSSTTAFTAAGALALNGGSFTPASGSTFKNVSIASGATLDMPVNGAISVKGNWSNNGTFNANGGTVTFNGSTDQSIGGSHSTTFAGLSIDNAGHTVSSTIALTASTTTVTAGTFSPYSGSDLGVASTGTSGSLDVSAGKTITLTSLDNHGAFSPTGGTVNISGALTNSGTFDPSGGLVTVGSDFTNSLSGSFSPSAGSLLLGGNLVNNGTFTPDGTSGITFDGSSSQHIRGSNAVTFNNLIVNNSLSTSVIDSSLPFTVNGTTTVTRGVLKPADGSVFIGAVTIGTNGTLDGSAATTGGVNFGGDFTNNGAFTAGNGLVTFNGTTDQSIGGSTSPTTFNNLVINNPGHTVTGNVRTDAANLAVTSGAFAPADGSIFGSVVIQKDGTLALSGSETVYVTHDLSNAGVLSPTGGTLDIGGNLHNLGTGHIAPSGGTIDTLGNFTNDGTFNPSDGTFDLAGNLTNNGTFAPVGGTFNFDGKGAAQTVDGNPVSFASLIISNPFGVNGVPISGNDLTIPTGVNYTPPAGSQFHNVTIDLGATLTMPSDGDIGVSGNWINNGTFAKGSSSTVTFDGSGAQSIGGSSVTSFGNLVIDNTGGTVTGNTAVNVDVLTVKKGIFDPADGSTFGDVDIQTHGTLTQSTGTVLVTGNLSNEGTLSPSGGTLNLDGTLDNFGSFHPTGSSTVVNVGKTFNNQASGTFDAAGGNLNLASDLINDGTFHPTGGTVTFNSLTKDQVIGGLQPLDFNNLVIDNKDHTVTGSTVTNANLLTIANGTFHPANGSTFVDALIQSGGILTLSDGETINVIHNLTNAGYLSPTGGLLNIGGNLDNTGHINPTGGTIDVKSDFTNQVGGAFVPSGGIFNLAGNLLTNGDFNPAGGTFDFNGVGPQSIDGSPTPINFYNVQIDSIGPVTANVPIVVAEDTIVNQGVFAVPHDSSLNNISVKPGADLQLDTTGTGVKVNAPVLTHPIPDQTGMQGTAFNYTFADNTFTVLSGSMTYTATRADGSALPSWLIFNPVQRNFSGTPKAGDVGLLQIKLTAASGGGTGVDTFYITIQGTRSQAPVLVNPIGDQNVKEGVAYTFVFPTDTFFNPDGTALSYRADGLPLWLHFDGASRTFSGTPVSGASSTNGGLLNIVLTAVNNTGGSVADSFAIHVYSSNANVPPSLHSRLQDQNGVAGTAFSYVLPSKLCSQFQRW